ncbi:MAG: tetratricopeptide repeat protein [Smithella sp.]
MSDKMNISSREKILIVYVVLAILTLAVFWQVHQYGFVFDDALYVTENNHVRSGISLDGFRLALSTRYVDLWDPLIWLSLALDYQLFGLNAGGYHMTNLILHILSTLLLFWLFRRMTGALWKSAFVAAFFALHPLHVESVAWVAERKDVLSAFFWMLTLCLYVYYVEKPDIKRYLLVLCGFILALMSKPMVVTLPVMMILLDYWPLNRFESQKGNLILWQLKGKALFFILSAATVIITLYNPNNPDRAVNPDLEHFPLSARVANAPVAFVTYLEKTFWPHDMAILYPFPAYIPVWQVIGAVLLIVVITAVVVTMVKRLPYLFVGWLWYAIAISPVIGIIQISFAAPYAMADRYHYLPSIGMGIMLAWGWPSIIKTEDARKNILFPAGIFFMIILAILAWRQCGYWKNNITLFSHALQVTKDNYLVQNNLGLSLFIEGNKKNIIEHYTEAIHLKPNYVTAYHNRGLAYIKLGQYRLAIEDFDKAIALRPNHRIHYLDRGSAYFHLGQYQRAVEDYNKAIHLQPEYAEAYNNRGSAYFHLGQYQRAVEDYNKAIHLQPDYAEVYQNRGFVYLNNGNKNLGCLDVQKACKLGNCKALSLTKKKGVCE